MNIDSINYTLILYSTLCIILGILISWFYLKNTLSKQATEIESIDESLNDLLKKYDSLLLEKIEIDKQFAVLKQDANRIPEIEEELKFQQKQFATLQITNATLEERLESKENESREKLKFLEEAKKLMGTEFENLSAKIFETKAKQFTEVNKDSIQNLLNPIQSKMKDFQEKVEKFHLEDVSGRASIKAEFEHFKEVSTTLSQDAQNLTTALTGDSKQQGDWGEMILEKCLQNAGLVEGEHYQKQIQIKTDDGTQLRPDVIINLPNDRILIADSKVSLTAYNSYMSADDEETRKAAAKKHLLSVRSHIQNLSSKNYQEGFEEFGSPDYVLMFMQIEPAYSLAQSLDSSLTSDAFSKNIILVTPASLMMALRIVNQLWRQEKQVQNVKEIFERGGKLYEKINGFLEEFIKIGEKIKGAQQSYETAHNRLSEGRGSMVKQAEMLKNLGVKTAKSIPREFNKALENSSSDNS
ncbi:MAG: DNA recombination protein RmuC [SAR324 cluster bacterium]|nr:DNA recombination protein RmuC [SAR324 cluster bacterium]MBL7034263.1 DNA recombination protein RmuC [SAR324 cluster bacterium]